MRFVKRTLKFFLNKYRDIIARFNLKKKFKITNKINVIFICQCQHIWDKSKPIVSQLIKNNKFQITLLIVEDNGIIDDTCFERFAIKNNIRFVKYHKNILKELNPNIIFYSRPYENYLPKDLRTNVTCKKSKLIYIPYGYSFMKLGDVNLNQYFCRNISLLFADCSYAHNYFCENNKNNIKLGYQSSYDIGFSFLEDFYMHTDDYLIGFSQNGLIKNNGYRVIWSPRWTIDDKMGGSNFFRYIDCIYDYLVNNQEFNFVFRPHPYAFSNYVETGMMTKEKMDEYINRINESNNSVYDNQDIYLNTLFDSDVLITDVSSMIAEYMLTKKPIIFCHNVNKEILNDFGLDCCKNVFYNAHSFEDIQKILSDLKNGIDPLKEIREKYIDAFFESFIGTNERIEKILLEKINRWFK